MKLQSDIGWGERFALIDHFNLSDQQAIEAFDITNDELSVARDLQSAGSIQIATDLNFDKYIEALSVIEPTKPAEPTEPTEPEPITTKPEKKVKAKPTSTQKRGRKGTKIVDAFRAVPTQPMPVEEFVALHEVSLPVLRQYKRFDKTGLPGTVRVRKDKETSILMVWRDID